MRKSLVIIGTIIFVLGVILFGVGTYLSESSIIKLNKWYNYKSDIWISDEINSTGEEIIIVNVSKNIYLINSTELSLINKSNIKSMSQNSIANSSGELTFIIQKGSYYLVTFSNSTPTIYYYYAHESSLLINGLILFLGIIFGIVGIIILIIGFVLKPKKVISNEVK
ncbi:MAG: hypothetical protein ACP5JT_01445 [Thermoplasmata archaeon]|jgi:hypothetical protein